MSGIITGPHFRRYFNHPKAIELGTMVAILEVGAFCGCATLTFITIIEQVPSYFHCRWPSWGLDRPQGHPFCWRCHIYNWWLYSDLHNGILDNDIRPPGQRVRCWSPFVRI
jgi:hypothetical protein